MCVCVCSCKCVCVCVCVCVFMRACGCGCEHESRGARQVHNKQSKATPTRTTSFSNEKGAALGGSRIHDTLRSRQSALPTELPAQLSRQDSKSTTQHNTRQSQTPILCAMAQIAQKNPHLICRSRPG